MFDSAASVLFSHTKSQICTPATQPLDTTAFPTSHRGSAISAQRISEQGALTEHQIIRAHLRDLGIEHDPPPASQLEHRVLELETKRAAQFHPDINLATMRRWKELSECAQTWGFQQLSLRAHGVGRFPILLGTTSRVVDHIVDAKGLRILIEAVYKDCDPKVRAQKVADLKLAIETGPPAGAHSEEDAIMWSSPATPTELVASIVRSALLAGGDKRRARVSPELRLWIRDAFAEAGHEPHGVLGGFAAYGSQLALAHHYTPTMLSRWMFPSSLYESELLPKNLRILTDRADCKTIADIRPEEVIASAGHYCFSLGNKGSAFLPPELCDLCIDGELIDISAAHRCEVIVSGSHAEPGFGDRTPEEMRQIGSEHRLMCLTGLQYFEKISDVEQFFYQLPFAREAGTPCCFEYSEPKASARPIEMATLKRLKETDTCDLLAMNTSEAFGLIERFIDEFEKGHDIFGISAQTAANIRCALSIAETEETPWGDGREDPRWIAQASLIIQEILDVPFVRVRGMWADVTSSASDIPIGDPAMLRRALFFSRDQAVVKVANPSGSIRSLADQAWVWSTPTGQSVAAAAVINDCLRTNFAHKDLLGDSFMENGYARLKDERMVFFALAKPMLVATGGTTSAGDTMGLVAATGMIELLETAVQARKRSGNI